MSAPFFSGALVLGCSSDGTDETPASGGGVATGGATATGGASSTGGETASGGAAATGGTDGTGGTSGGSCETSDWLLCDDFETGAIDESLWKLELSMGNTLEVVSDEAALGGNSVHILAHNGMAFLTNESIFPVANNDYFGRMYVRVARFSTVDWAHWTIAEGAGTGNGSKIRVGGQYVTNQSVNRWGVGSDGGETGDWTTHDSDPNGMPMEPAENVWHCVEWQHKGSTNETRFYLNGVEHPSLATTAENHGGMQGQYVLPNMTRFRFGWQQYQSDPAPFELWIDELALDDERIGCSD